MRAHTRHAHTPQEHLLSRSSSVPRQTSRNGISGSSVRALTSTASVTLLGRGCGFSSEDDTTELLLLMLLDAIGRGSYFGGRIVTVRTKPRGTSADDRPPPLSRARTDAELAHERSAIFLYLFFFFLVFVSFRFGTFFLLFFLVFLSCFSFLLFTPRAASRRLPPCCPWWK